MKKFSWILSVVAVLALTSCSNKADVISIGGAISLHGDNAMQGELGLKGMMLAVDNANAEGGIAGKKLKLVVEDTYTTASGAINAMAKLTKADKVDCILTTGDVEFQAINDYVEKSGTVTLSTICSGMLEENRSQYLFRYCFNEKIQDAALMQFVKDEMGADDIALLFPNNSWGQEIEKYTEEGAAAAGVNIGIKETYDPNSIDQKGTALKLLEKKPRIVCARGFGSGFEALLRYMSELGFTGTVIGDITISLPSTFNNTKGIIEGAYYVSVDLKPEGDEFTDYYRKSFFEKYGTESSVWDALGYDSCVMLIEALKITHESGISLQEAIFKVKDAQLLLGDNKFEGSNDVEFNMSIFRIVDGKQTLIQ